MTSERHAASLLHRLRYGGTPHEGAKTERTVAVTWGSWGGIWFHGGGVCWRLCLGFVAVTYVRAEMTQLLDAWLSKEADRG